MAFKDSLRLEQIYFQKLKDMIKTCKAWYDGENTDKDRDILEALIQACAAILLLYRNLGEEWNELTALIQRTMHDLVYLKEKTDVYHDELNEKIDEVNNYLNAAITIIEAQIDAFGGLPSNANANEGDVLTVGENHVNEWKAPKGIIFLDANWNNEYGGEVNLTLNNEAITAKEIYELLNSGYYVKVKLNSFYSEGLPKEEDIPSIESIILDLSWYNSYIFEDVQNYSIEWKTNYLQTLRRDEQSTLDSILLSLGGSDEEESDYAFVKFNNIRGFNFALYSSDTTPIPNNDVDLISGITFKQAFLMGQDYFSRNGTLTYAEGNLKVILPLIAIGNDIVNTQDPEKPIYRLILRFYDVTGGPNNTNFEWDVYWDYNTLTDEERIYIFGAS